MEGLTDIESLKAKIFLNRPETKEDLRNWISAFLGLDLPDTHLDGEGSNSSPMESVWLSYKTYLDNSGDITPGYILLSARDAGKTLGASVFAVVALVFFNASICWLASIEPQSKIALNNIQSFIQKLKPYLEFHKRILESSNARNLELVDSQGKRSQINILVATMASVNGKHVNLTLCDEVDLIRDPRVLDEVQAVASLIGNQFPLKLYLSTRKFAFGQMELLIQKREEMGLKLLKWDILDVTEYCPPSRHKPETKEVRYIHPEPPLKNLSQKEYDDLTSSERKQYEAIEAYGGCSSCKLLSQCKTRLAHRSPKDQGMLWKKIDHTINMFKSMSPDMATAQLLCRRPSQSGLVYPRFSENENVISIDQAFFELLGEETKGASLKELVAKLKELKIPIYVSGDWGSTASQAFVVSAALPLGKWWIIDAYAIPDLEFDDVLKLGMTIRDEYNPVKWFMDTNQPAFIKAFKKNGMACAKFDKDVMAGIESTRKMILDSSGSRKLKVIKHDRTEIVLEGFRKHHFKLDSLGNPTQHPDDGKAWSDICDSIRYLAQNIYGFKGGVPSMATELKVGQTFTGDLSERIQELNNQAFKAKLRQSVSNPEEIPDDEDKEEKKGIFFSF